MQPETLLTTQEVAQLLHADGGTVLQYARCGEMPGTRIGKEWIFFYGDVLVFLRRRIDEESADRQSKTGRTAVSVATANRSRRKSPPKLPSLLASPSA